MFWISGLFWGLGGALLAVVLMVFCSSWKTKKDRKKKFVRGPWRGIPSNFEVPSTGVRGEVTRGPESWWSNTPNHDELPYV